SCRDEIQTSPRSGRQHKAWGGAQRNPRTRGLKPTARAAGDSPASRQTPSPASRANVIFGPLTWGSAALHPWLYAGGHFAGWTERYLFSTSIQFRVRSIA